ncbi:DUF6263 family protein [Flavobacterium sp. N1736]|uniref:DUF6263 family protein n=1 Tax=Flavobacterium sp. N1736 TaxID=2986823 RepID=UPI00222422D7|nr:DUF6263 family protein [Flavobacterium sp. N1736]
MKNILLFILISVPFFNYGQSDKILDFKIAYSPQATYRQVVEQSSETELYYIAADSILEVLKSRGVENPTRAKSITLIESNIKTGKEAKDGNFPVIIEFLKSTNSEQKASIIPDGTLIYGKASLSTMPQLDSIVSKGMDESFKKSLLEMMQKTFSQIALPEKKMKVGESFSQENPLNIPIAGMSFDMQITTIYKLISIESQTANFEIVQKYTANISDQKYNIEASGNGNGKLRYDIPNHFANQYILDIDLVFDLKQDAFSLKVNSKSGFNQTVQITKN